MVSTVIAIGDELKLRFAALPFVQELFDGPTKTARIIGIDGLKDEQDGTGLEEANGANEGSDAASVVDFAVKFG